MIKVQSISKKYGGIDAVTEVSFEVGKGEVVGFLGPNGAGKSTTMRILAGYLPPTSGQAFVAGYDVFEQSREARGCIGYMPENVPLYTDMRVDEYLRYRAALKGVPGRKMKERLGDAIELCGLSEVSRKIIGTLSKGYRQRVGLADALVHEPQLLILDEPTVGLDPNQIRQVRELIRNLGRRHTVLLSTHILPEVELTCSRVIIIDRGRIMASDSPANLVTQLKAAGGVRLEVKAGDISPELAAIPGVRDVTLVETNGEWKTFVLKTDPEAEIREAVARKVSESKWPLRELGQRRVTLEDVFTEFTQSE
jgi:ABC-2 type transport system ATP-binding protein